MNIVMGGKSQTAEETVKRIEGFLNLPVGWYFGTGRPPDRSVVQQSLKHLNNLKDLGLNETWAFPGPNGEIEMTAYLGDFCIEVTVEPDLTFSVAYEGDDIGLIYNP